jgi:hypothetical protein
VEEEDDLILEDDDSEIKSKLDINFKISATVYDPIFNFDPLMFEKICQKRKNIYDNFD